jgi:predicted dehydrogenase
VAEFYMQGLANVAGHRVAANYSRDLGRAREFGRKWSIEESTADLDGLIARDDIDLFVIALPNETHEPVSIALAEKRRNQVCTKPLGRNRAEGRRMRDAAVRSGAIHGYAETEVFAPCVVKARELVAGGGIGRVLWVRSRGVAQRAAQRALLGHREDRPAERSAISAAIASKPPATSSARTTGSSR